MGKRLCIVTLDPHLRGGILSMMKFVYKQAEKSGFSPVLAYNLIARLRGKDRFKDITFLRYLRGRRHKIYFEDFDGMNGIAIERLLPEFEFFNYILNLNLWREVFKDKDIFFAMGGNNNCALPLALLKKNYLLWVASLLYEDRKDRIKKEPLLRKLRDYSSLPILLYYEKVIFERAKRILTLSNYTKEQIIKRYNIDESKIISAPFPIDPDRFYPINYSNRKRDYILFVGRIEDDRKNLPLLLSAFSRIKPKFPGLKLVVIGGRLSEKLVFYLNKLKIWDSVKFIDYIAQEALLPYYQNALLFAIPSHQEGLCISGLEALSCGIPVISTRCGGPEDYIKDGENGYLVNNDVEEMSEAILKFLYLSEKKKREMSLKAREYILENHTVEKIWPKFLECFKDELSR